MFARMVICNGSPAQAGSRGYLKPVVGATEWGLISTEGDDLYSIRGRSKEFPGPYTHLGTDNGPHPKMSMEFIGQEDGLPFFRAMGFDDLVYIGSDIVIIFRLWGNRFREVKEGQRDRSFVLTEDMRKWFIKTSFAGFRVDASHIVQIFPLDAPL